MKEFVLGALPWVAMGLAVAFAMVILTKRQRQTNKEEGLGEQKAPDEDAIQKQKTTGICLGIAIGIGVGLCFYQAIGLGGIGIGIAIGLSVGVAFAGDVKVKK